MTPTSAARIARRLRPSFHDLGCAILLTPDALYFVSPRTGSQAFHFGTSTAARVETHAQGFLAAQPLPAVRNLAPVHHAANTFPYPLHTRCGTSNGFPVHTSSDWSRVTCPACRRRAE